MSLYEILSMFIELNRPENPPMSDAEFEAARERWRKLNLADVRV